MKMHFLAAVVVALATVTTIKNSVAAAASLTEEPASFDTNYDQILNLPFIKEGGSDLFYYYVFQELKFMDESLKGETDGIDPSYRETLRYLCHDSGCDKGLDLAKINSEEIFLTVLKIFSWHTSTSIVDSYKIGAKHFEAVGLLQGFLAPAGWNPFFSSSSEPTDVEKPKQIAREMLQFIVQMQKKDVRKIIVNLPDQFDHYQDVSPFVHLGLFIKDNKIDLHIIRCGTYCASYLLPAAQTVYIEPYGYFYTKGSATGSFNDTVQAVEREESYRLKRLQTEWLSQQQRPQLVQFVKDSMTAAFGFPPPPQRDPDTRSRMETGDKFIEGLVQWTGAVWGADRWKRFSETVISDYESIARKRFKSFDRADISGFVESLDTDETWPFLQDLAVFFRWSTGEKSLFIIDDYIKMLRSLMILEKRYYIQVVKELISEVGYSYKDFLALAAYLVRDRRYERMFSVSRNYYAVPEKERPYDVITVSADLLRTLGFNVKGENSRKRLERDFGGRVLYLNERKVQSCNFFKKQSPYTKDTLEECLSRGE